MRRLLAVFAAFALMLQTTSCGLVLYPERQGQKSGNIDPAVAILDAAGLIVFIIPGLVAFAVDFMTGCIYLPGTAKASVDADVPLRTVYLEPQKLTATGIEDTLLALTGKPVDLRDPSVRALAVADVSELSGALARPY